MNDSPPRSTVPPEGSEAAATELPQSTEPADSGPNLALRKNIEIFSKYGPLFRSVAFTLLGALFAPALLAFIAFELSPAYEGTLLRGAIFRGLITLCVPLLASIALARALRPKGLAEQHFGWSSDLCEGMLKSLKTMIWIWLPLRFMYTALETFNGGKWNDSLGRILFIAAMAAFAAGLWMSLRSFRRWISGSAADPKFSNLRTLSLWFLPLLPATLAVMSALGYHFTAVQMSWRAMWTVLLMIGISMIGGFVSRLLLIAQFGIKLRQLSRNDDGEIKSEESIDIGEISMQVNRLLRATALVAMVVVGWQIWSTVLPAITYLDSIHLWESKTAVDTVEWITLRHLLMSVGLLAITFILSRNLPGLLEITLLDRLPLDRGGRYAISFVVRYLVSIFGILAACQIVGFSWASVQWLAAGLTVGLGFGLQEIFANIVSGIIILIERPIRVGDVVTVNNVTGTVTRMQLRATTIKDLDYRELIVPNKKFITEDVMNWTLSDRSTRLIFRVGVAYGSNTELVQETLLKVAHRHPLILEDPHPEVVFKDFGDSTLNFELRVVIPTREVFAKVQHEMNMAINAAFRAKEIEIAFPQRELRIKNLSEFPQPVPPPTPPATPPPAPPSPTRERNDTRAAFPANPSHAFGSGSLSPTSATFQAETVDVQPMVAGDQAAQSVWDQLELSPQSQSPAKAVLPFPATTLDKNQSSQAASRNGDDSEVGEARRRVIRFPLKDVRGGDSILVAPRKQA